MTPAIRADNLGKRYLIAQDGIRPAYRTLRETLVDRLKRPLPGWRGRTANGSRQEFWALQDVAFEISPGEAVGIIGPNGAGKSTLLKILSRITKPTTGQATLRGRVGSLLEVGTGFHAELTGRENIFLNGSILGMSRREIARKFDEIVAFADIGRFLDTPVKRYSSGMYVRLAFAVAAHLLSEILIVDEVLAVGDAAFQKKCLGKMGDVAKHGRTVLFVSHNLAAVTGLCSRAFWMRQGRLHASGTAREVVSKYLAATLQGGSARLDLETYKRSGEWGQDFRITAVEWLTGHPLKHGEPVDVRLHGVARAPCEEVVLGLGFSTLEGVRILSYDTDLDGYRRPVRKGVRLSARLHIPKLMLAPGLYQLDVGVRSGDNFPLDYIAGCSQVEVLPGSHTPNTIRYHPGSGVRLCGPWSWEEAEEPAP